MVGVSYSPTQPMSIHSVPTSTRQSHVPSTTILIPNQNIPTIHQFITNWLIMDPSLLNKYQHNKKQRRNYQIQPNENMKFVYLLGGRFRTIKTKPITILTGLVIVIPGVLFWIFEAKHIWRDFHPAIVILFSYLWWLTFMFYFKSTTSDPGIIPRNIHLPKTLQNNKVTNPPEEYFNTITLPHNKHNVQVKYCASCHIWRPPRTSHCSTCQVCILSHDHHCIYLNNCIGERNYRYFLWFLLTAVLSCIYLLTITIIHLTHTNINQSIRKHPVALLLFIYSILALIYPFLLLLFHVFLTSQNLTTREYLNYVYKIKNSGYVNGFDQENIFKNLYINWIGKSGGIALVRPRDKYEPGDLRFENIEPLELAIAVSER
ncbi:Palmitoyltransferase ERF2 [Spathaspora sp. JA1]|nr:Palmitoyltransferase ERF2 [Spathaspora sp. JA1]